MLNYELTEEQKEIRELCRRLAEEKIKPYSQEWDEANKMPDEVLRIFAQSDLFSLLFRKSTAVWEEDFWIYV